MEQVEKRHLRWLRYKVRMSEYRRQKRMAERNVNLASKACLLCEIRMTSKFGGCFHASKYCNSCRLNYPRKVKNHISLMSKWRKKGILHSPVAILPVKIRKTFISHYEFKNWNYNTGTYVNSPSKETS